MTSQRISELLKAITPEYRDEFYSLWCSLRGELEYLALDITSVSSYSELIDSVEWGYNRDGEQLQQINICMLMGYRSRLPIYQTVYSGSLKDVSTLQKTIGTFHALTDGKPIVAIMDKGFYSTKNVDAMLANDNRTQFLIAVPFTSKFALTQVENERGTIDTLTNTIVVGADSMRAVTRLHKWSEEHQLYTHIYYNAKKANGIRESLYSHVTTLKEYAEQNPKKCENNPKYTKYLKIQPSQESQNGYCIELLESAVFAELKTAGWMVLLSNRISDSKEAIRTYREKDIVEKGFQRLKNCLDLGRLRVHSEESMQSKVFVGFIALILLSCIHQTMADKKLYARMSMKKLLISLSNVKAQTVRGVRILFPLTKEQRSIYEAFGISLPA
jgi:transposase